MSEFTASLAAIILEDGTSFDKGPFGLGNTESDFNLKYSTKPSCHYSTATRGEAPLKFIPRENFEDKIFTARDQTAK